VRANRGSQCPKGNPKPSDHDWPHSLISSKSARESRRTTFQEGQQIKYRVEVVNGLENAAEAVNKLFDGSNQGKLMVKVSEEP